MTKYYTPKDLADKLKLSPKNVRRMLRAKNIRVGRGQRHVFDAATFNRYVKDLTTKTDEAPAKKGVDNSKKGVDKVPKKAAVKTTKKESKK